MDTLGLASFGRFCHLLATIFSIRLQWLEVEQSQTTTWLLDQREGLGGKGGR